MFVKLVEDVKAYGGEVLIFSSMHESGQREFPSPDLLGAELIFVSPTLPLPSLPIRDVQS